MTKSRALMTMLLILGVFVLLGGMSLARQSQNTNANSGSGQMTGTGSSNANQAMTAKSSDAKFMMTAAEGGMAEVEMARIAQERASSDAVKQYAQRMIDDHTKAGDELKQLAATKGITLPTGPNSKQMALMEKLRQKTGADFDRMYIKESGVKAHQSMEKLFQKESTQGKDADARAFAAKTLPTVQEHLRMARDMSATMTGTGGNMNGNGNMSGNGNMNGNMSNSNTTP
jgi:putative membrane protein